MRLEDTLRLLTEDQGHLLMLGQPPRVDGEKQEEGLVEHTKLPRRTEEVMANLRRGEAEVKLLGRRRLEARRMRLGVEEEWDRLLELDRRRCRYCTRADRFEEERERGLSRRIRTDGSL